MNEHMSRTYRIAYIAAGAAGMYCGSCIRDNTLVRTMVRQGHDAALIPTYTPLRTDEAPVGVENVFYNGLRVYLEQKIPPLRSGLNFLDRIFDSRPVLRMISRSRSYTNARNLGELTVSVLRGEEGNQRRELDRLADWLAAHIQPEIVHLTNSMFAGMARTLKNRLHAPVFCTLQGEDIFLDDLVEPYRSEAKSILWERTADIDLFMATSDYYADFMSAYLGIERSQIVAVPLGITLEGHEAPIAKRAGDHFTIGFLARICPEKGLHHFLEAAIDMARRRPDLDFRVKIAGYLGKRDQEYFDALMRRVGESAIAKRVTYVGEVDRSEKIAFLRSLDVLSVPTVYHEPKGMFALEAMVNGVPVVLPHHGAFPEIIEKTRGGLLVAPNSPEDLSRALLRLNDEAQLRCELGRNGREGVLKHYTDDIMAAETVKAYASYFKKSPAVQLPPSGEK